MTTAKSMMYNQFNGNVVEVEIDVYIVAVITVRFYFKVMSNTPVDFNPNRRPYAKTSAEVVL